MNHRSKAFRKYYRVTLRITSALTGMLLALVFFATRCRKPPLDMKPDDALQWRRAAGIRAASAPDGNRRDRIRWQCSRRDPKGKEGLAELTADSLALGTKDLTETEFNQKVDFMGSEVAARRGSRHRRARV